MPATDKTQLAAKLARFGQEHVLRFWDELDDVGRNQLAAQVAAIDLAEIAELYQGAREEPDWANLARRAEPPKVIRAGDPQFSEAARQRGREALAAGEVGVLLVAGGQGSRLGFEHAKGLYPIGPISEASLLQIHLEKALAATRRYGRPVPVYLMTSPVTHNEQVEFLEKHDRFGLKKEDLIVFCQGTMPAVDAATGKLLLAAEDSLFLSPDGHGGMVAALAASGALEDMRRRGIRELFYLQVDNPLVPICDPEIIGHHVAAESDMTSIAVAKLDPRDRLGNFVMLDGRMQVIEYSDFPDDVAEKRAADGSLIFWAGSIAVHVFDVAFLERSVGLKESLPFHVARKKVPFIDERGQLVESDEPNALKFERFIFDLLPHAKNPVVVECAEEDVFAPLKNAPGAERDTAEYVQRFMVAQHRRWLEAAGVEVSPNVAVEISPLWALDAEGVEARSDLPKRITMPTYLKLTG
jgi:UDP-N-acetylglucosamine/UDP-N-acetylgalactosamine diphosphorylase